MRIAAAILILAATPVNVSRAQTAADTAAVFSVIETFFDALETADSTLMASILLPGGTGHMIVPGPDSTIIRKATHEQTLESMAMWNQPIYERMWNPTILIQEPLAVVWGPYDLYVGDNFSHCGIDVCTLIKTEDGWKISSLEYTVQRENCTLHPDGPPGK